MLFMPLSNVAKTPLLRAFSLKEIPKRQPSRYGEGWRTLSNTKTIHYATLPTLPSLDVVNQELTLRCHMRDPALDATLTANKVSFLPLLAARLLDGERLLLIDTRLPLVKFSREFEQEEPPEFKELAL